MQTAVAEKTIQQPAEPRPVSVNDTVDRMAAFTELITRKAFDIFLGRGRFHGHDLDDWLRAEEELFHRVHLRVYEGDDVVTVEAEVPGFRSQELEVTVEPYCVIITGDRTTRGKVSRKITYCDTCPDRIFRALSIHVKLDPKKATAALKDGALQLTLPMSSSGTVDSYSLVRAADARQWTESFAGLFPRRE